MDNGFKASCGDPAMGLLIYRLPRRKVRRQPSPASPRRTCPHDVAHRVEHVAQVVATLGYGLGQQAQIGGDKGPFFITDFAGIGTSAHILYSTRGASAEHALTGEIMDSPGE
jgi:hypothetical protein